MPSEFRQRLRATGSSLAGDGMLVRLRRTSIALLCAVAAVGLGLIAFISQLGFPDGFSGPLPGSRVEAGTVHSAIALTQRPRVAPAQPLRPSPSISAGRRTGGPQRPEADAGVGGSRRLVSSPAPQPSPAAPQPSPAPVSQPPTQPAPAAPPVASTPAPAPSPSATAPATEAPQKSGLGGPPEQGSSGKSRSKSKGTGPVTAKVTGDASGKPVASSTKKSKPQPAAKDVVVPPPPAEPASKTAPDTAGYAAAKEASDTGESDKPHH